MRKFVNRFIREEHGQDMVEYTLLLAFITLTSAALFIRAGASAAGIWVATSGILSNANTSTS